MLIFHIPSCSFIIQDPMLRGNSPVSHAGGSIGGALGHVRPAGWMSPADIVWLARPRRWCFGMALNTFSCIIIQSFNVLMAPYGDIPRRSMMYMLYHIIAMYISLYQPFNPSTLRYIEVSAHCQYLENGELPEGHVRLQAAQPAKGSFYMFLHFCIKHSEAACNRTQQVIWH